MTPAGVVFLGGLFPAPAGMNRRPAMRDILKTAVPRARGDEPAYWAID